MLKIDLHVHSKFSTRPTQWLLQRLGCAESYTEPLRLYAMAKKLGMDQVTITDHNTINGALEIAHLPDAFVSVEATAYFPEDRCKIHVLVYDIDEATFAEVQRLRENIYEFTAFLRERDILHVCAHPLYGDNTRLTVDHVEKLMLLFKNLECNGARDYESNDALRRVVASLTPAVIERLATKHGIEPGFAQPWRKNFTGGSDDHSGLNIARMHTVAPRAKDRAEFFEAVESGQARPAGKAANPETMAHNIHAIAYQFFKSRFDLGRHAGGDLFLSFIDRFLGDGEPLDPSWRHRLNRYLGERRHRRGKASDFKDIKDLLRYEAANFILETPEFVEIAKRGRPLPENKGKEWFDFVSALSNRVLKSFGDHLLDLLSGANIFDIFQSLGSAGALYTAMAPLFVGFSLFQDGRRFSGRVSKRFLGERKGESIKIAHFTDTFMEVNGVARTLQQNLLIAEKVGKEMTVLTCYPESPDFGAKVMNFKPIGVYALPEYPEQEIFYPPVVEMIRYVYEQGFTHLHVSTPGPIGLAALLTARILKLPISGVYHTQIPQYAKLLTGDEAMEDLLWTYAVWFYNQMDQVFAPSQDTAQEIAAKGVRPDKVAVYPRGVDVELYHPSKRNGFLKRYGAEGGPNLLYVGRISKEKNLDLLADAFLLASESRPEATLILVGDGPYAPALKEKLADARVVFTGYLEGEDLAACYASSDLFVFPSLTDTFGNVILEAQASGTPVLVTNSGGPKESVAPGETGFVLDEPTQESMAEAILRLTADPERLRDMGRKARAAMEDRSLEKTFLDAWRLYEAVGEFDPASHEGPGTQAGRTDPAWPFGQLLQAGLTVQNSERRA